MSQEDVEIIKRGIDAFNRRDVNLLAELTTADFAWFPALPGTVEVNGYHGREGMETYFAEIRRTWEELRVITDEVRDLGDGAVLLGRTEGRGRASGARVDAPIGIVYEFREGRRRRRRRERLPPSVLSEGAAPAHGCTRCRRGQHAFPARSRVNAQSIMVGAAG